MANILTKTFDKIMVSVFKRALSLPQLEELIGNSNSLSYDRPISFSGGAYSNTPQGDNRVTSKVISSVVKDPYVSGMLTVKQNLMFKRGWYVGGGKNSSKAITDHLKQLGIDDILQPIYTAYNTHGNGILFFTNRNKLRFEPFLAEGHERVKVIADHINREILSYQVCHLGSVLMEIPAGKVLHIRNDSFDGDFRFGTGAVIAAVKAWFVKQEVLNDSQQKFRDGSQANGAFSPRYDFAKDSPEQIKRAVDGYDDFRSKVTQNRDNLRGRNIFAPVPINFDKFTMSNVDMGSLEFLREIRKEISAALGVSLAVVGDTAGTTFANAEQGRDNVSELIIESDKRKFDMIIKWVLKNSLIGYSELSNPYFFGREPTDEEIKSYEAKTDRANKQSDILVKLSKVQGYKLDLTTMEIKEAEVTQSVQSTEPQTKTSIVENEPVVDEAINKQDDATRATKTPQPAKFTVDNLLLSKPFFKLQNRLEKALTDQLNATT